MTKICGKCKAEKPLDKFGANYSFYKGRHYGKLYYRSKCKACKSEEVLEKYHANREVEVVKLRERATAKRKADPSIHRHNNVLFKRHIKAATPPWVDKKELKTIYDARPAGYDVDHIVPLKGKNVWGLHVPYNLQYLPSEINRNEKRNKVDYNVSTSALQVKKSA